MFSGASMIFSPLRSRWWRDTGPIKHSLDWACLFSWLHALSSTFPEPSTPSRPWVLNTWHNQEKQQIQSWTGTHSQYKAIKAKSQIQAVVIHTHKQKNMSPSPGLPGTTFFLTSSASHFTLCALLNTKSHILPSTIHVSCPYAFANAVPFSTCSSSTIHLVNSYPPIKTLPKHNLLEEVFSSLSHSYTQWNSSVPFQSFLCIMDILPFL